MIVKNQTISARPLKNNDSFKVFFRIIKMSFKYKWRLFFGVSAIFFSSAFSLYIPLLLGNAVDAANNLLSSDSGEISTVNDSKNHLYFICFLLLLSSIGRGTFAMIHVYFGESIGQHIGYELRMMYYEKLQRLSFSYHAGVHTGDLITRGILDVEGIRMFVQTAILRVIFLTSLIGTGTFLMIKTNPILGLISLSFVPFVAWKATSARLKLRSNWYALQDKLSVLTKTMDENLGGIRVVRAFSAEEFEMKKYKVISDEALKLSNDQVKIRSQSISLISTAFFISMGLVLLVGGRQVMNGTITPGELTQFLAFMSILLDPVRQIGLMINGFARGSASGGRLFAILDLEPNIHDEENAKNVIVEKGRLEFRNVSFTYEGDNHETIHNVSFTINPGETLGIVGPPGSGKSTIAHLIPRFYDPNGGSILIDDIDIRNFTLESLRHAVCVVEQDTFMFTASIEHNIAYGNPWAPDDRVEKSTHHAQLAEYIERLPEKYKTLVGERGVSLSGGQRQRLSIARSVMMDPNIIIFDDSTAAIDAGTERKIREELKNLTSKTTTIIISHRLSSLMHANKILFLDRGRIIESGSHNELLELKGQYEDLYNLQNKARGKM